MDPTVKHDNVHDLDGTYSPSYDRPDPLSVFDRQASPHRQEPEALSPSFVKAREEAQKSDLDDEDDDTPIALPPYITAVKKDGLTHYAMAIPETSRPKSWPENVPLGAFRHPREANEIVWKAYHHLLHDLHEEQLRKAEKHIYPVTLKEIIEQYRKSRKFKKLDAPARARQTERLSKIEDWSAQNRNPPISSITPEHIYGYLIAEKNGYEARQDMHELLVELFELSAEIRHTDSNPAAETKLPDPDWDNLRRAHPLPHPTDVFAHKPTHPHPVFR